MKTQPAPALPRDPLVWKNDRHHIVVSPVEGGRVMSWRLKDRGELVRQPQGLDGGLMRVLVSPERYPGSSYVTPHLVLESSSSPDGFRIHMRYKWNTSNAIAGILGWKDKANPAYLDGLMLDKILSFDAARGAISIEMRLSNVCDEVRWINPWLQCHFHGWVERSFVVIDGKPERYLWLDQYWGSHTAPKDKSMRLVNASADERLWTVLGADTGWLDGMASYTKADFAPTSTDGIMELRGASIRIPPHHSLVCNAFVALAEGPDGWKRWASESPVPLSHRIENGTPAWKPADLIPLLDHWALEEERKAGMMILSHLDKLPFSTAGRFSANQQFSRFRVRKGKTESSAWVYALQDMDNISAKCDGPAGWSVEGIPATLSRGRLAEIRLQGPADLSGHEQVRVILNGRTAVTVATDAAVTRSYPYQLRQPSAYFDERFHEERTCFAGDTAEAFGKWQNHRHRVFGNWARSAITRPVPMEARVTERQEGPTCIREKIVVQTEPGMWIPMYFVRPRRLAAAGPLPAIVFLCGSGPGKSDMIPDETVDAQGPDHDEEWPSPYAMANRTGCVVACPDHRGWGEWSEANHNQQPGRGKIGGFNIMAMDVWDHMRAVDYLCSRPDIDSRYIFCMGSSGGGYMTRYLFGGHERVTGGIISSSPSAVDDLAEHFFFRSEPKELPALHPPANYPMADAAVVQLGAPKPVWIMDGLWDRCALPALPVTDEQRQAIFAQFHRDGNAGRDAVRHVYRLLGAEEKFRSSWFDGDHLAGFHYRNIREWLLHYWPEAFQGKLET